MTTIKSLEKILKKNNVWSIHQVGDGFSLWCGRKGGDIIFNGKTINQCIDKYVKWNIGNMKIKCSCGKRIKVIFGSGDKGNFIRYEKGKKYYGKVCPKCNQEYLIKAKKDIYVS